MDISTPTTVDLIRHGEPIGGIQLRGWKDDPLSELGWLQMREAIKGVSPWHGIVSSPMSRCSQFATEVAERLDLELNIEPRLKEIGFGDWEGKLPAELYEQEPDRLSGFWQDPVNNTPPNGEPLMQFQARVTAAWQEVQVQYSGKHLLLVAHGGVNRVIISHTLGMPLTHLFRLDVPYACLSKISIDHGISRLISHGVPIS